MALTIEESIQIAAPPETIWRYISDPFGWRIWWPQCKSAETTDRKPLRDGSQLEIVLEIGVIPITLRPIVEVAQPHRVLLWTGKSLGVTRRHAFYLEPRPTGTFVRQCETFDGPGLPLFRLFRLDHATIMMFKENLKGLKRAAERAL